MTEDRGGGAGGFKDTTQPREFVNGMSEQGDESGDQAGTGTIGKATAILSHKVGNPWHCQAVITEVQRIGPRCEEEDFWGRSERGWQQAE